MNNSEKIEFYVDGQEVMSITLLCNEPRVFRTTRNSTDFARVAKDHLSVRDLWLALAEGKG